MTALELDTARLMVFAARLQHTDVPGLELRVKPLRGGLEATAVARVTASRRAPTGRVRTTTFVVKRLDGANAREARVYSNVLHARDSRCAPAYLGSEQIAADVTYLYLEYVRRSSPWPWRNTSSSASVLTGLASVHQRFSADAVGRDLDWDYDAELRASAEATLNVFEEVIAHDTLHPLRPLRGALSRTVGSLHAIRQSVLRTEPLGATVVHGDVHSGNVLIRGEQPVLLDWGRARVGSALEDVSSWLQSLGFWEPEAKRCHDTLLRHYLASRGYATALTRPLRDAYWLAAACNVLSGALRYHLVVADGWRTSPPRLRAEAVRAARDQLRIIRRADAVWRA
jgi:hypothetical protein